MIRQSWRKVFAYSTSNTATNLTKNAPPSKGKTNASAAAAITPRADNFSQWYLDILDGAKLAQHGPVKGTMVLRPNGYALWEMAQGVLDKKIKETGHRNAYFPCFIPIKYFNQEAQHVDGFAKECAVVTHHRLRRNDQSGQLEPDPESLLEEPLIVRPTSETVIWKYYSEWVDSYRDLPILINQWANVVRWEMRPRLFLRTTEFLWQEGHTAHASKEEALEEATKMLGVYEQFCEEWMAIPVIPGRKSPRERFAGADETFTIEALLQNGWALQAGTSHFLGQNFPKAFNVTFLDEKGERKHAWGTSWGVSTRLIGGLIMSHSDDIGLVLPPKIAPTQIVVIPIFKPEEKNTILATANELVKNLTDAGLRVTLDVREDKRPGAKYYEWERAGVPLRLEFGSRDLSTNSITASFRYVDETRAATESSKKKKTVVPLEDIANWCKEALTTMQSTLYNNAKERRDDRIVKGVSYAEMVEAFANQKDAAFLVPWAESSENEEAIQNEIKATIRCYPRQGQEEAAGKKCFYSGNPATHMALFARAF